MKYILLVVSLVFSCQVLSKEITNPVPKCGQINRVGSERVDGSSSIEWVSGISHTNEEDCSGLNVGINDYMVQGDYAYGVYELQSESVNEVYIDTFKIKIKDAFNGLSIGKEVVVAELYDGHRLVGDLVLRKTPSLATTNGNFQNSLYLWKLLVRWNSGNYNVSNTVDSFYFTTDEVINVSIIWDEIDPEFAVGVVSFGDSKISINPFSNNNVGLASVSNSTGKINSVHMGIIDSTQLLGVGDKIEFEIKDYSASEYF